MLSSGNPPPPPLSLYDESEKENGIARGVLVQELIEKVWIAFFRVFICIAARSIDRRDCTKIIISSVGQAWSSPYFPARVREITFDLGEDYRPFEIQLRKILNLSSLVPSSFRIKARKLQDTRCAQVTRIKKG